MASPISRRPTGLLDLLLTQQQGKNPDKLGDDVIPVIEMRPFYSQERFDIERQSMAITVNGDYGAIEVPAGETWFVYAFGLRLEYATAAQYLTADLTIDWTATTFAGFNYNIHGRNGMDPDFANQDMNAGFWLPQPLVFPSGVKFNCEINRINLDGQPNILGLHHCLYTRMET